MTLMFSDISSTLLAPATGSFSGAQGLGRGALGLVSREFIGQLNRALQSGETCAAGIQEAGLLSQLENTMGSEKGVAFLVQLKSQLLSLSNGDLKNMSLNGEGLDALEKLLTDAGFDSTAVEELMAEFSLGLEEGEGAVLAADFVDRLFELPREEDESDVSNGELLIPSSDLPYIQSVLGLLGLDPGTITGIMDKVSLENRGLDLDSFIKELRQLSEASLDSGTAYQTQIENDDHVSLLNQLGFDYTPGNDRFSLGQLIKAFEQKQQALSSSQANNPQDLLGVLDLNRSGQGTSQPTTDLLAQLFAGLDLSTRQEDIQKGAVNPDVTAGQTGESFKSDFLNQINGTQLNDPAIGKEMSPPIDPDSDRNLADPGKNGQSGSTPGKDLFQAAVNKTGILDKSTETGPAPLDEDAVLAAGQKVQTTHTSTTVSLNRVKQSFAGLPDHVTQQVSKNIVRAINLGENTLRLQLKPAELGRVFMTIDNTGDTMKVSIITEHQSAKDILAANVNEIKTILSSSGISLERFDVDMSSDFRQSMADARGQGQSGNKRSAKQSASASDGEDDLNNLSAPATAYEAGGSLHLLA